jgi:hypothetical protein
MGASGQITENRFLKTWYYTVKLVPFDAPVGMVNLAYSPSRICWELSTK